MPITEVVLFQEEEGQVPLLEWFSDLVEEAQAKCRVRLERLAELGYKLRRPEADYLRGDIYELRVKHSGVNYRMLYFFHGRRAVVVSHGFTKQQKRVPEKETKLAIKRKRAFEANPEAHTYSEV